jgi:hypothetical protein
MANKIRTVSIGKIKRKRRNITKKTHLDVENPNLRKVKG